MVQFFPHLIPRQSGFFKCSMFKKRIIFYSDSQTVWEFTVSQKLSKFSFPNYQNFPLQTVKIFIFQTVKIFLFKLSKFNVQTVKSILFQTVKIFLFQTVKSMKTNWLLCREISDYGLVCRGSKSLENTGLLD
jgi:hypothetical protein